MPGVRGTVYRGLERGWMLALRLLRPVLWPQPRPRPWTPGGRVVIVAPHPDDETLAAGGVAALHCQAGDRVTIVVVSDGRGSRAGGLSPEAMAARRHGEVCAAAGVLGVRELAWMGLPEGEWPAATARQPLGRLIAGATVVYGPSCVDFHPEHLKTAHLLAELVSPEQSVRVCELGVPLTPALANVAADIGGVIDLKRKALAQFAGQAQALAPLERLAGYRAVLFGIEHVEVFWELPPSAYRRIMAYGTWGWQSTPFRSIRPRPFSDPAAMLAGWRTRSTLRDLAAGLHGEEPLAG